MIKLLRLIRKHKEWTIVATSFLFIRVAIFASFLVAGSGMGGWGKFYDEAQPAHSVFRRLFHDFCDWHPPLYYTFTSVIIFMFRSYFFIYLAQVLLAFVSVWLGYKITRLFFCRKISFISTLFVAVEPYWAFHNFLFVSENLFTPLMLAGIYYFFVFIKNSTSKHLYVSAMFLGFATMARSNTLVIIPTLSILLLIVFALKKKLRQENVFSKLNPKQFILSIFIFNLIFFGIIAPWVIRNKVIYGQATLANMLSTNIFFYNLPPLISMQKNISYFDAYSEIVNEAKSRIREPIDDQGDCRLYGKEEFIERQNYYDRAAKNYILANFADYVKMHLVKTVPFFFQSGYFEMWSVYSGEYSKPDITALVLKKDLSAIKDFFKQINAKLIFYLSGAILLGIASVAAFLAVIYSYFKDRERFLFFLMSYAIILFNAILIAPFVLARYRLPINTFFFIPFVYMVFEIINWKFKHKAK